MSKNKIIYFGSLVLCLLIIFLIAVSLDVKPPKISLNEIPQINKIYVVQPINSPEFIQSANVVYPQIEKPLPLVGLFLQDFNERKDIKLKRYDYLFLATKRISELELWGNDFTVVTWENKLGLYENVMEKSITEKRAKEIRSYILSHLQKLNEIISGLNKNTADKTYLKKLSNSIFSRLNNKIDSFVLSYDPRLLTYSLTQIESARDYGIYNASLDTSDTSPELINQVQTLNNNLFSHNFVIDTPKKNFLLQLPYKKQDIELKISKEFEKKQKSYTYYLTLKSDQLKCGRYIIRINYKFDISVTAKFERLFKNSSGAVKADEFVNEIFFHTPNSQEYQKIIEFNANKYYTTSRFVILSPLELESNNFQRFDIEFTPYYRPEIIIKKISQLPDGVPQIHYSKLLNNKYEIKLKNVNLYEAKYLQKFFGFGWKLSFATRDDDKDNIYVSVFYWPAHILKTIILILLTLTVFKIIYFYLFPPIFKKFFHFIYAIRQQLFLLSLIGIAYDIFSRQSSSDLYIILFSLLWISTIVGFKTEARSTFVISLILLVLSPLYSIKKQEIVADKLVVWSFIFSLIGIFQTIINHNNNKISLKTFYDQTLSNLALIVLHSLKTIILLITLIFKMIAKIANLKKFTHFYSVSLKLSKTINYNLENSILLVKKNGLFKFELFAFIKIRANAILISIGDLIKKIFLPIFNLSPKTFKDWLFNVIKVIIIFIFLVSVIMFINFFQHLLEIKQRQKLRETLNPKIIKFDPKIVYRSTKVIIYGRGFNWKPGEPALRLMTQYGEVEKELWTDTKIIFTVPLHWKNGKLFIWIEKPISWENKIIVTKSEIITLKLIPASSTFTPDDDAFFKQLKHLDKEILEINGYK